MVNSKLPIPILKYLEITPEALGDVTHQYPFYIFPMVARALNRHWADGIDLKQLNFFGFHTQKLADYAAMRMDEKTWVQEFDKILPETTVEQEESPSNLLSDGIKNSSSTELSNLEIETKLDELDSPNSEMNEEDFMAEITLPSAENKEAIRIDTHQENSSALGSEYAEDVQPELKEDTVQSEETNPINHLSSKISNAIHINQTGDVQEILSEDAQEESLKVIDLSQFDVQLLDIGKEPLDIEIDFQETTADEELAEKLLQDNTEELIQPEINDTPISAENNLQQPILEEPIPLDSISDHPFELDRIELNTLDLSVNESIILDDSMQRDNIQFVQNQDIEEKILNTLNLEDTQLDEINDFSGWLHKFSQGGSNTENILPIKNEIDSITADTDELDKSIQLTAIETTYLNENIHKINQDNELEGVLKDNFFITQVEIKKAHRKTPSEMRIQDEAQLSLQPLDIVSETLAILHTQQGNTAKAIDIYEKLIALIPEKSSFFALQIQNLRKL